MSEAIEQTEATATTEPATSIEEAAKVVFGDDTVAGSTPDGSGPSKPETAPEAEPAAETKTEEPVVDDKVSRKIAVARRAELAAAQARRELRVHEEKLTAERAALDAERKRYELLAEDPVKAFEVLGIDPKTFLEKLAGEHKPENVHARELANLKAELAALKESTQKEQETAKQRQQREAADTTFREAATGFIQFVGTEAEKYPHLVTEFSEDEAINEASRALHEVIGQDEQGRPVTRNEAYFNQFGTYPDNDVIAEHLDQLARQRAEARQNSAWAKRGQSPTNGSQPLSIGDPNPKAHPAIKGPSPRTLTSRAASEKASPPKQWSQDAADEESLRILQSAFR